MAVATLTEELRLIVGRDHVLDGDVELLIC